MIEWKLKSFLRTHAITPYHLAKASSGRLSMNAAYNASDPGLSSVRFETLNTLLETLSEITGQDVKVTDLIEFYKEGESGKEARKG